MKAGTTECIRCDRQFTDANPCWNSEATYSEHGREVHIDGVCRECASLEPVIAACGSEPGHGN